MDVFFWPVLDVVLWGFLSIYLANLKITGVNIVTILIGAIIFWEFLNQSQKAISIAFLEEVWERNFLNIFVTPLSFAEFLFSTVFVGLIRIILVSIVMGLLAFFFYHFNLLSMGFLLIPFVINLLLFGWVMGIFTTAIILRYGTSAQILAWGLIAIIQPFSAVFYPVSALPSFLHWISYLIPTTYVFEGMRKVMTGAPLAHTDVILAFITNICFLVLVLMFFSAMFRKVKAMGRLLKLD
jgi:ABC-2 type transport system permease protein